MKQDKIIGVYFIKNKITGKFYVGHSIDINKRFIRHKRDLNKGNHHCIYLQRAWDKYSEDDFEFIIYKECETEEESIELEQYFIDNFKEQLYNTSNEAGFGGDLLTGNPRREEIIEKRRNTCKRQYLTMSKEDRIKRYSKFGEKNGMYGKTHTPEVRKKLSEKQKGIEPGNKGKKYEDYMSEKKAKKIKEKLSEDAKQRTGEKNPFYGKAHSEETKEKLRQINLGKKPTNSRPVELDGVYYESVTEASRQLGVVPATIINRIKSKNYPNCFYVDEKDND